MVDAGCFQLRSLVTCPWYTRSLRKPHIQKSQGFRSGDLACQIFGNSNVLKPFLLDKKLNLEPNEYGELSRFQSNVIDHLWVNPEVGKLQLVERTTCVSLST
ncbi:hypothetical protein AVEN_42958-1 [Araneus ventricosus]|uniref:Uncharacterized protein n=1 Tax=Araneus ventricosus TaxID=182803 RepID=A0A4Y2AFH7_ARAVE|nr:hypothetical protein AVEN_42958-1 [Araneus ventricosus]